MPSSACAAHLLRLLSFPTRRSSDLHMIVVSCASSTGCLGASSAATTGTYYYLLNYYPQATASHAQVPEMTGSDLVLSGTRADFGPTRSEEHTSELQSLTNLVCRLLLAPPTSSVSSLSLHDALPICT